MNKTTILQLTLTCSITLFLGACADKTSATTSSSTVIETLSTLQNGPKELLKKDIKVGDGTEAKKGQQVTVHYTGWLFDESAPNNQGKKFDSSVDRGQPFVFPLGAGRVIRGWDEGVAGMKVGGKRTLIIPADMGYGSRGAGNAIPPNATLLFDVELLGVK